MPSGGQLCFPNYTSKLLPTHIFNIFILVQNLVGKHVSKTLLPKKIIFNNRELQRKIQKMHISVSLLYILTISISTVLLRAKYSQMLWHNQDQNYYPLVPRYIRFTRYVFIFVCDEKLEKLVNLKP